MVRKRGVGLSTSYGAMTLRKAESEALRSRLCWAWGGSAAFSSPWSQRELEGCGRGARKEELVARSIEVDAERVAVGPAGVWRG